MQNTKKKKEILSRKEVKAIISKRMTVSVNIQKRDKETGEVKTIVKNHKRMIDKKTVEWFFTILTNSEIPIKEYAALKNAVALNDRLVKRAINLTKEGRVFVPGLGKPVKTAAFKAVDRGRNDTLYNMCTATQTLIENLTHEYYRIDPNVVTNLN